MPLTFVSSDLQSDDILMADFKSADNSFRIAARTCSLGLPRNPKDKDIIRKADFKPLYGKKNLCVPMCSLTEPMCRKKNQEPRFTC
ncbi:hypothetical protein D0T49_05520 [Paludibacter sp. 221]|nr:hypothetical protein [Paludibacter sp. 221]